MTVHRQSPCKVNLLLNTLGKRPDGFHELETVFFPIPLFDDLIFEWSDAAGTDLSCNNPSLPLDQSNLVLKAAAAFRTSAGVKDPVHIHLEKRIPVAAGLGGGSSNAAHTLAGLNELFSHPLDHAALHRIAAQVGSDVPFFLQASPAIATGRGEVIRPIAPLSVFEKCGLLLIHPGFGVATPWAYRNLSEFPAAQRGSPGRAEQFLEHLNRPGAALRDAGPLVYNALEYPVFVKFPILPLLKRFLKEQGASVALMSGSGSTTFAILPTLTEAESMADTVKETFGETLWTATIAL